MSRHDKAKNEDTASKKEDTIQKASLGSHPDEDAGGITAQKEDSHDALYDKYLRLCAEFDNARKRWERDRAELIKYAHSSFMSDILVIIDELEHALRAIEDHAQGNQIKEGIQLTYKNMSSILRKYGLTSMEVKGKEFDPHLHEIVGHRPVDEAQGHIVLEEVQKGYMLEGKLLRTAKVIVGIPQPKPPAQEAVLEEAQNTGTGDSLPGQEDTASDTE